MSGCALEENTKPNFLIILIDDLGSQDIGVYGQRHIATPNIDSLAADGMRWTDAYSACPVCSPTRAALLTGRSPARVHFTGHITAVDRHRHPPQSWIIPPADLLHLPHEEVLLSEALKPAGYISASIGKWHVGGEGFWPTDQGFDYNVAGWTRGSPPSYFYPYESDHRWNGSIPTLKGGKEGEYLTDRLTTEAIDFIRRSKDKPFLLYLSHYAVHRPLQAPQELIEKYATIMDDTGVDPVYAAMVENLDWNVGRLLKALKETGISENTVVIFTSDNGAVAETSDNHPFREGKGHLYEGGIRVPLIVRWPGQIDAGSVYTTPTISHDIYSTVIDIAGEQTQPGAPLDGRSLMRQAWIKERDLHWYYPHYVGHAMQPGAAIRSGVYKLIEFYDPPRVELYNLQTDIGESRDLSTEMPEKKEELLDKLHQWLKESGTIMHTYNYNRESDAGIEQ